MNKKEKSIYKRGPYKIKKITKNRKGIESENEINKIGYQEQLYAVQEILKSFKENMIENFVKGTVKTIVINDIQNIIDKLDKRKKNILKYDIPFEPSIDIIADIDIINSQTLIEFEKLLESL